MTNQLEALKKLHNSIHGQYYLGQDEEQKLIDAIYKQALAETEKQEPVAEVYETEDGWEKVYIGTMLVQGIPNGTKLYTHPSTWQSLSHDELSEIFAKVGWVEENDNLRDLGFYRHARAIEQALRERNHPCK